MFCPDCGGICDSRGLCPACEQRALERAMRHRPLVEPPWGRHRAYDGDVTVEQCVLIFRKKRGTFTSRAVIAYNEIEDVSFRKASSTERGYLVVRKKGNAYLSADPGQVAGILDTALVFGKTRNRKMEKVARYIYQCVRRQNLRKATGHSGRRYCPDCDSRNIRNLFTTVPTYTIWEDVFVCEVCGFSWEAFK